MRKRAKLTYLIYLVLMLVLAGNASAVTYEWDGGGGTDTHWNEPNNWDANIVPTSWDYAVFNLPEANGLIDSGVTAECLELVIADDNGPCYMNMTGGSLNTRSYVYVAHDTNATASFTMSDGTITSGNRWLIGFGGNDPADGNAIGTFRMTGGDLSIDEKLEAAENKTGIAYLYIEGGSIYIEDDLELGSYGIATMEVSGGADVNVNDRLKLVEGGESASVGAATLTITDGNIWANYVEIGDDGGHAYNGHGTILLTGGLIQSDQIDLYSTNSKIDINEGTLRITMDSELEQVYYYVSEGYIIGYHDEGVVDVNWDSAHTWTNVTAKPADPNLAGSPTPRRYKVVPWTPAGPNHSWAAGYAGTGSETGITHDVYFGVNDVNVKNADNSGSWDEFLGNQDPCTHDFPSSYRPPVLGESYYWRIDEVNSSGTVWGGDLWQYTIEKFVPIDDFESYPTTDDLNDVWVISGSEVSLETTIAKSGKSMKYDFDNANFPFYTEAEANAVGADSLGFQTTLDRNWDQIGIKALMVNFYGTTDNNSEPMYVALKSTDGNLATVYYDDSNDLKEPKWHEWNIKLSDFKTPKDVNLNSIDKIYLGFGNREVPDTSGGGSGTVYFDDIRLYPRRCVPIYGPVGDLGGTDDTDYWPVYDCTVDNIDVNIMAEEWLKKDYNGVGKTADVNGSWVTNEAAPHARCVKLDGINNWVNLDDMGFSDFHNKSISFWVKVLDYPPSYRYMFYFSDEQEEDPYRIEFRTYEKLEGQAGKVRLRFIDKYTEAFPAGTNWTHLVFTIEDTPDGLCTGRGYAHNAGKKKKFPEMTARLRHTGPAFGINIGSQNEGTSSFANVLIDDFRVYDCVLTVGEINWLGDAHNAKLWPDTPQEPDDANFLMYNYDFNEGTGTTAANKSSLSFYHPLLVVSEISENEPEGQRSVDFKDFSTLANNWLKEQLWP